MLLNLRRNAGTNNDEKVQKMKKTEFFLYFLIKQKSKKNLIIIIISISYIELSTTTVCSNLHICICKIINIFVSSDHTYRYLINKHFVCLSKTLFFFFHFFILIKNTFFGLQMKKKNELKKITF